MLEIILIAVAFVGSGLAALIDLKTTEIPDKIPYAMMIVGIIGHAIKSYSVWDYGPILSSSVVGLSFLGFGFLMYKFGQWGGGDAKVLSGVGFLLPELPSQFGVTLFFPFPLSFFLNVFLIGAIYMIVYALILSAINKKIPTAFFDDLKANSKPILAFNFAIILSLLLFGFIAVNYLGYVSFVEISKFGLLIMFGTMGLFFLWKFAKVVEEVGFKRRVKISNLRVGDVLLESRVWDGITEEELTKIKKSGKKRVWIKEGIRFAPAFPLALAFTLLFGDGIVWLLGLL